MSFITPKDANSTDISDYERIMRASHAAYKRNSALLLEGDFEIHRPLIASTHWAPNVDIDTPWDVTKDERMLCRHIQGVVSQTTTTIKAVQKMDDEGKPIEYLWNPVCDAVIVVGQSFGTVFANIEKIKIDANDIAAYGALFQYLSNGIFTDIITTNALRGGVVFEACQTAQLRNITSTLNKGFGALFIKCNGTTVFGIKTTQNSGDGLVITHEDTDHGYIQKLRKDTKTYISEDERKIQYDKYNFIDDYNALLPGDEIMLSTSTMNDTMTMYPGQGMLDNSSTIEKTDSSKDVGGGGMFIFSVLSEGNGTDNASGKMYYKNPSNQSGHAIALYKDSSTVIEAGWIEGNKGNGIYLYNTTSARISALKLLESTSIGDDEFSSKWLRIDGEFDNNRCVNNMIENCIVQPSNDAKTLRDENGTILYDKYGDEKKEDIKPFGVQGVVEGLDSEGNEYNEWDNTKGETIAEYDGHQMVEIEEPSLNSIPPFKQILNFKTADDQIVATAKFLSIYKSCLQFFELKTIVVTPNGSSHEIRVGEALYGPDPLSGLTPNAEVPQAATKVTVEGEGWKNWEASLVAEDPSDLILRAKHQLHRNHIKQNWQHFPTGNSSNNIQRFIKLVKHMDSMVLANDTVTIVKL